LCVCVRVCICKKYHIKCHAPQSKVLQHTATYCCDKLQHRLRQTPYPAPPPRGCVSTHRQSLFFCIWNLFSRDSIRDTLWDTLVHMGHSCAHGHTLPHLHSFAYGHCFLGTLGVLYGTILCIWAPIVSYSFFCIWALVSTGALCGTLRDTFVHVGHHCPILILLHMGTVFRNSLRGTLWDTLVHMGTHCLILTLWHMGTRFYGCSMRHSTRHSCAYEYPLPHPHSFAYGYCFVGNLYGVLYGGHSCAYGHALRGPHSFAHGHHFLRNLYQALCHTNMHIIDISSLFFSECHPYIARALNTRMIVHILAFLQKDTRTLCMTLIYILLPCPRSFAERCA